MDILFLAHRAPFPPDRGDRIRSFNVLRYLSARARVHLVAFADTAAECVAAPELRALTASCTLIHRRKSRALAAAEALAGGLPVSLTAFADPALAAAVAGVLDAHRVEATYCFSGQMAQYLPAGGLRTLMDFCDVDSAKFAQSAGKGAWPLRWLMRREARLLGAFERQVSEQVAATLFVSDAESALFREGGGRGRIETVENGIDTAHFDPAVVAARAGAAPTIVFTGQMDYPPNVDAAIWFAQTVLPRIHRQHPDARFAIVGRAPTAAVRALAGTHVEVTGEIADTRPWLTAAAVAVAPLSLARGIQNKVLEAMAMARPVVATAAAAEGIDHCGTIRVADDADAFAASVAALLDDRAAGSAIGSQARAQVIRRYAWDARLAPLDALLGFGTEQVAA
jgi:sugar transferase (PEP-CTERM/EpsH1 system associated)